MSIPIRLQQDYSRYNQSQIKYKYNQIKDQLWKYTKYLQQQFHNDQDVYKYKQFVQEVYYKFNTLSYKQQIDIINQLASKTIDLNQKQYYQDFKDIIQKLDETYNNLGNIYPENLQYNEDDKIQIVYNENNQEIQQIEQLIPNKQYKIIYKDQCIFLDSETIYKLFDFAEEDFEDFKKHLFVMLLRYQTYQGNTFKDENTSYNTYQEGVNLQAGVYQPLLTKLNNKFDLQTELFASPNNVTLQKYYTQFYDTDQPFKSKGNCFDLLNNNECLDEFIECNPPFTEEMLLQAAQLIIQLLKQNRTQIVLFVCPSWRIDQAAYHTLLDQSEFKLDIIKLHPHSHKYQKGGVYTNNKDVSDKTFTSSFPSEYYILCNEQGKQKAEKICNFIKNYYSQ